MRQLQKLVKQGESETLEFKKSTALMRAIFETMRGQLNHSWEKIIAEGYKITDLNREEIFKTVSDGISENRIPASAQRDNIKAILKRLKLIEGDQLKNAAVALYAKPKSLHFMHCMIKMARFKGTDHLGEFIDNQQIRGNCFDLLEAADAN